MLLQNMESNLMRTFVDDGIIIVGEFARKDLIMIQRMIKGLFTSMVYWTVENKSIAELLMMILSIGQVLIIPKEYFLQLEVWVM